MRRRVDEVVPHRRALAVIQSASAVGFVTYLASCAPARQPEVLPAREPGPRLPPVPEVVDELRVDVVHPPENAILSVGDSTFVFGNVGRGDAALSIDGVDVEVAPNGAWLAYLPVPRDGVYDLVATAAGRTVTSTHTVRVPEPAGSLEGGLRIIEESVSPTGTITGVRGERIEVRFRGSPGAVARIVLPDGRVVPMVERTAVDRVSGFMLDREMARSGVSEYVGSFELTTTIASPDTAVEPPTLIAPERYLEARQAGDPAGVVVELARGPQFVQVPVPVAIGVLPEGVPAVAVAATARPDSTVIGRRGIGADQAWDFFWPNGTLLPVDGERGGFYRVRLTDDLSAWVVRDDVRLLPAGAPAPRGFVGPSIQLTRDADGVAVRFNASTRLPFRVAPRETGIAVEFYGATGRPAYVGYAPGDDFVDLVDWEQESDELFRFDIALTEPLWGYRYRWEESALILEVRRPPAIDVANPLRGLRIGVDAGHRGSADDTGAIGPTRLDEVDATTALAVRLIDALRRAGAEVVEIRTDTTIVPLIERPILATREDVHLLVSLHFNAFPDGVNPFENHGTTMFYFWPHSLDLARHLQREVVAELGLPDRGVRYQNLAMTRTTWMPAVLTESLYMMFPEQEAALRDPAFLGRLAEAHLRGLESFVRQRAGERETVPGG